VIADKESGSISPQISAIDGAEGSPMVLSEIPWSPDVGSGHGNGNEGKREMEIMELSSLSEEVAGPEEKMDREEEELLVRMDGAGDGSWG
jgi:hypothetical protein